MLNNALPPLFSIAGWHAERLQDVDFSGGADPILPTPFRISEASSAALAAVGLAASDLWYLRTGRHQNISIDVRQTTASLRSLNYLKVDGVRLASHHSVMGVYPAKDGRWHYLHCNFPNRRAAALRVLGVPEDREAVSKAVAKWDALELEEAIISANGAGGMVRTLQEWREHPQGAAVAALPLMEIIKIDDSPAEPLPQGNRPLSGIRVLDLTRVVAGPVGGRTLAEHGADVLRITAEHLPSIGYQEYETGHGKFSAHLDLREPNNLETLHGLIRECDVFSQGYRPGTLAARGLSPEALAQIRPGIVAVSLCAFSHVGPWASRRGFDTVIQHVSGITDRQGELFPGAVPGPQLYPVSAIDYLAGYLIRIRHDGRAPRRAREGGSWHLRISLAQVGRCWRSRQVPEHALKNIPKKKRIHARELERWTITTQSPLAGSGISNRCWVSPKHRRIGCDPQCPWVIASRNFHRDRRNNYLNVARISRGSARPADRSRSGYQRRVRAATAVSAAARPSRPSGGRRPGA